MQILNREMCDQKSLNHFKKSNLYLVFYGNQKINTQDVKTSLYTCTILVGFIKPACFE